MAWGNVKTTAAQGRGVGEALAFRGSRYSQGRMSVAGQP